jgi:hypothetical protein
VQLPCHVPVIAGQRAAASAISFEFDCLPAEGPDRGHFVRVCEERRGVTALECGCYRMHGDQT